MRDEKELGKVTSWQLFKEDHGILTFFIHLDFGGACQGFGGYALDTFCKERERRIGTAFGTEVVLRLMALFGVDDMSKVVGRSVFALRAPLGSSTIIGLEMPSFDGGKRLMMSEIVEEFEVDA